MLLRATEDVPLVTLIEALQAPAVYDHPVDRFELIETHISWVLLTGPYAYKIKKPVNLGFLDFSTLEKRYFSCREELRLNRRLAPDLYVDVVPIVGSVHAPSLGGTGPVIEYAVKMRQFAPDAQLDRLLARGELSRERIDALAGQVAAFHARIAVAGRDVRYGEPEMVRGPIVENVKTLLDGASDPHDIKRLVALRDWSDGTHAALTDELSARKQGGFVRECHGDLHLANIAWVDERPLIFDGIEFSESLRWIDVMSEAAFLTMDLDDRGAPDLGHRWLNAYLELTGDYAGVRVLRFYQVYRALVRAKVALIRAGQAQAADRDRHRLECRSYLDLAERYTAPARPVLVITRGLSGSGKTTVTQALIETWEGIRVRSDVERKRLHGLPPLARTAPDSGLYTPEAGARTYERLAELARIVVDSGHAAVVDAAFLRRSQRDALRRVADQAGVPFVILDVHASAATLGSRIVERGRLARDASDADLAVLDLQRGSADALGVDETRYVVEVDTDRPLDVSRWVTRFGQGRHIETPPSRR